MKKSVCVIILAALLMTGCADTSATVTDSLENPQIVEEKEIDIKGNIDLSLLPNESGKIMLLMYHNIGAEEAEWVRTADNFIKDLTILYDKGYRPISLQDYVTGNIETEQGFTPIVITFDDGNLNNFEYLENGSISTCSAVGLLLDFNNKHKDFPLEATFFINGERPFNQKGREYEKLSFIIENGMDIGNHTKNHMNLKNATAEEIQEQIGYQAQFLQQLINKDDHLINTLALPFGARPKDETLTSYLSSGSYNGMEYKNIAILNVGWNPAYSPYDKKFDYASIPRIRASEIKVDNVGLYNYIDYFDRNPKERFISDGIDKVVTVPKEKAESIEVPTDKELYIWEKRQRI